MGARIGHKKAGGRQKGTPNKRTLKVEEMAEACGVDPFQVLLWVAAGDWGALGFDAASKVSFTNAGIEFEEPNIKLSDRVQAAKEAAKYLHSQKQSVSVNTGDAGIKIIVEEYSKKSDGT